VHLNIYYDAVIASLKGADSIPKFVPGEAKDELGKRLKKTDRGGCIVAVETVEKTTRRQIAAKVRKHFAE